MKIKHSIYLSSITAVTFGCGYSQKFNALINTTKSTSDVETSASTASNVQTNPSTSSAESTPSTAFSCQRIGQKKGQPDTLAPSFEVSYRDNSTLMIKKHQVCGCKTWNVKLDYSNNHVIELTPNVFDWQKPK